MERYGRALRLVLFFSAIISTADAQGPSLEAVSQGNNLVLSWTNDPLFRLESTTNLSATNWISISNAVVVNGKLTVTNATPNLSRFYRLKKPCGYEASPVQVVWLVSLTDDGDPVAYPVRFETNPTTPPDTSCTVEDGSVICTLPQSPLDASLEVTFDASQSIDPRSCTNGSLAFHWEIFKPIAQGGELYTSRGITGYHSPILRIAPNSLPSLPEIEGEDFGTSWRIKLTLTHQPFDPNATPPQSTVARFRFQYLGSLLTVEMSTTCQSETNACPTCPCTITNALPTLETP